MATEEGPRPGESYNVWVQRMAAKERAEGTLGPPTPPPPPPERIGEGSRPGESYNVWVQRMAAEERAAQTPPLAVTMHPIPTTAIPYQPEPPSFEEREAAGQVATMEERLTELQTAVDEAPRQLQHETHAKYEQFYEEEYRPAYERHKELGEERRVQQWGEFSSELKKAGLTEQEIENIRVNFEHVRRTSRTSEEFQARWKGYIAQWESVIATRRAQELRAEAQAAMKKPFSLEVMERAELFPEQYRGLPGPMEDAIAGMAKGGGLIIGAFEEAGMAVAGLAKPESVAGYYPAVSPISAFIVPEYRKWAPYAIVAAPIIYPLEAKAFGAGLKLTGKAVKMVAQAPFKGLARVAPVAVKTELKAHPIIARWFGVAEPRIRTVPGVLTSKFAKYQVITEAAPGVPRTELAMIGGVIKPAPRWLMPSTFERLMPSAVRAKLYAMQAVRGAAKPAWMSRAAYEAMPKYFMQVAARPTAGIMGLRAFEIGKKQVLFTAAVKRTEQLIMGGRAALGVPKLAFKPTIVPYLFRAEPLWHPFIAPAMGMGAAMATAYKSFAPYDTRIKPTVKTKLIEIPFVQKIPAIRPTVIMDPTAKVQVEIGTMAQTALARQAKLIQRFQQLGQALSTQPFRSIIAPTRIPRREEKPAVRERRPARPLWKYKLVKHPLGSIMELLYGRPKKKGRRKK